MGVKKTNQRKIRRLFRVYKEFAINFITTDGLMELSFKEEAGKVVGIVLKIEAYGMTATGQKK